ncbi:hypothetical protein BST61_g2640 [Cercospora zeina]
MHTFSIIAAALSLGAAANDAPTKKSCEKQCKEVFINPKPCFLKFCKSDHPPLAVRNDNPATVTVIETLIYHETICPTTSQDIAISTEAQPASQSTQTQDSSLSMEPPAFPTYHTSGVPPAKTSPSVASTSSQGEQISESRNAEAPIASTTAQESPSSQSSSCELHSPPESPSNADQTPKATSADGIAVGSASANGASFGVIILGIAAML